MATATIQKELLSLLSNQQKIEDLTEEEATQLYSKTWIYGVPTEVAREPGNDGHVVMSIVNMRESYMEKFLTTALVGYLYRSHFEYFGENPLEVNARSGADDQENVPFPEEFFKSLGVTITEENKAKLHGLYRADLKRQTEAFLDRNFNYNPDRHLRSAHIATTGDPSRVDLAAQIRRATATISNAAESRAEFAKKSSDLPALCCASYNGVVRAAQTLRECAARLSDADAVGDLLVEALKLERQAAELAPLTEPTSVTATAQALTKIPPADLFYHLKRYRENHYEELLKVTNAIHLERADVDTAVQVYALFPHDSQNKDKAAKEAKDYLKLNESNFIADVIDVSPGNWHIIGPYKKNRDRIDFYNKNVEIFKRMAEQMEQDHKVGADFMRRQVKEKKKKNILEAGPDDPGLAAYKSVNNAISGMGGKEILSSEEKEKLAELYREKKRLEEQLMVPSNAVQVDVFGTNAAGKFEKSHFYTEAEAPNLVTATNASGQTTVDPAMLSAAQADTTSSPRKRVIVSRTGERKTIGELRDNIGN